MADLQFGMLDVNNEEDVALYERALFRAFAGTEIKTLHLIWNIDKKNRRISLKIPYSSQEICVARLNGAIIGAMAWNYAMQSTLQLEMIGFSIDKTEKNICEGLGIFSHQVFHDKIPIAFGLRDYGLARIRQKGIKAIWGTCSQKKLKGYQQMGFRLVDEREFEGEKKFLLRFEVPPDQTV